MPVASTPEREGSDDRSRLSGSEPIGVITPRFTCIVSVWEMRVSWSLAEGKLLADRIKTP